MKLEEIEDLLKSKKFKVKSEEGFIDFYKKIIIDNETRLSIYISYNMVFEEPILTIFYGLAVLDNKTFRVVEKIEFKENWENLSYEKLENYSNFRHIFDILYKFETIKEVLK